jgi:hypothetical protein
MPAASGTDDDAQSVMLPHGHRAEIDSFHCRSSVVAQARWLWPPAGGKQNILLPDHPDKPP